ncbi:hypothetical protein D3C87_1303630 [compost metagenome]
MVDREALKKAQQSNDIVKAQELLQDAFRTDVRALVAEARLRMGGAIDPVQLFQENEIRSQLIAERGVNTVATGL